MRGVRVFSACGDSGYGIAGVAYVRALFNAGVPVQWSLFDWPDGSMRPPVVLSYADALARYARATYDPKHNDTVALLRATSSAVDADVALLHTVPEHLPYLLQSGMRNVLYTTWESTALPPHWVSLLNLADAIIVPSFVNRRAFVNSGVRAPIHIVGHIQRSFWHDVTSAQLQSAREKLGLERERLTFVSIGTAQPRKNIRQLLRTFCHAFDASSNVQLLIKTSTMSEADTFPFARVRADTKLRVWLAEIARSVGRPLPLIGWIANDELSQQSMDTIHALADCFVSFSHGEGWGLGAFEAATLGTPVLMPAWGGHRDYLRDPWLGAVTCTLQPAPVWPMSCPSFWPDQQWAEMRDADCIAALRRAPETLDALREDARYHQAQIADEFSEIRIAKQLIAALAA
jgi:glycosyltransferase involved in cell wall biosynthesis